jgi:uncharacterized protein YoxC
MIIFVIFCNLLITVINCYLIIKIRQWQRRLTQTGDVLTQVERKVYNILNPAPEIIAKGEQGTDFLRNKIKTLEYQLQSLQKILALLNWSYTLWQWCNYSAINSQLSDYKGIKRFFRRS